jgi:hypothetical protein
MRRLACTLFLSCSPFLLAETVCSLKVVVLARAGTVGDTQVTVEESNGRKSSGKTLFGEASFCDLGLGRVAVSVGGPGCSQVHLRDVPLRLDRTVLLFAALDTAECDIESQPPNGCIVLFRFFHDFHRTAKTVSIQASSPQTKRYEGDDYGRVKVALSFGDEFRGIATIRGLITRPIAFKCTRERREVDEVIRLDEPPE